MYRARLALIERKECVRITLYPHIMSRLTFSFLFIYSARSIVAHSRLLYICRPIEVDGVVVSCLYPPSAVLCVCPQCVRRLPTPRKYIIK